MVDERRLRSRDFLRFAKEKGGVCCVHRLVSGDIVGAQELHHFGQKGMGQKSSDFRVARLCVPCHRKYQGKRAHAFFRDGELEVYNAMLTDSIELTSAYAHEMEALKSKKFPRVLEYFLSQTEDCARSEMQEWLLQNAPEAFETDAVEWMLKWANRRNGNVIGFLLEALSEIRSLSKEEGSTINDAVFIASIAAKRCCL